MWKHLKNCKQHVTIIYKEKLFSWGQDNVVVKKAVSGTSLPKFESWFLLFLGV